MKLNINNKIKKNIKNKDDINQINSKYNNNNNKRLNIKSSRNYF